MPEYTLIYFNGRGRAELTRWIFAYSGIAYEDKRIQKEEWPAMKSTIPLGRLPCLKIDDHSLVQSVAMSRYMAKVAGLVPEDNLKAAYCDTVVDTAQDIAMELFKINAMTDEAEKKTKFVEMNDKIIKPAFSFFEKRISSNDWIVGETITWADLVIGMAFGEMQAKKASIFEPYPKLSAHISKIRSLPKIKQWIEKRPSTEF